MLTFPAGTPGVRTTGALGVAGFADAMLPVGRSLTSSGSIVLSRRGVAELILKQGVKTSRSLDDVYCDPSVERLIFDALLFDQPPSVRSELPLLAFW